MKQSYICQTLRSPSLPNVGPNTSGCSNGYQRFAGSCYGLKTTKRNWADAQTQCQSEGANLVSIANVYEQSFVSLLVFENNGHIWTGLNDKQKAGNYQWIVNSDRVTYTNWGYNEPSKKDGEGCVSMRVNNKWDDSRCNASFTYVCEIVVTSQVLTTPATVATCQKRWTPFNGRCYREYSNRNASWSAANTRCKRSRSDLVSIHNADEDTFISSLITNSAKDIWLGLQRAQNGGYQYSDGTPTNYMNWDVNEPTDVNNKSRQNCVARIAASQRWNDLTCSFKKGYICVKLMALKTPAPNVIPITPKRQTPAPVTKQHNVPRTLFPNNLTPTVTAAPVKQTTKKAATQGNVQTNAPVTPVVTPAPTQFTRQNGAITQARQIQGNPNTNDSSGLSDGGVAGIVITVLLIVLVGMLAFGFMAKRNKWTFASVRGAVGFENALYNNGDQALTVQSSDA
ncbi:macrophage mannose receptor 1 [Patella vulgata]|uniref:macrophage mannose receptor 1 n=1 Tax=Patella vulgata TaxID=6465 RepID=UPI0024A915A3|nr:macrophage mannose receptor 1 [Patella vulgata]